MVITQSTGIPHALRTEPDHLRHLVDTEHRYALPGDEGFLPQVQHGIDPSVMLGDHPEADGIAIHGVQLVKMGEHLIEIAYQN